MTFESYDCTMAMKGPGDACQRPGVWPTTRGSRHDEAYLHGRGLRETAQRARLLPRALPAREERRTAGHSASGVPEGSHLRVVRMRKSGRLTRALYGALAATYQRTPGRRRSTHPKPRPGLSDRRVLEAFAEARMVLDALRTLVAARRSPGDKGAGCAWRDLRDFRVRARVLRQGHVSVPSTPSTRGYAAGQAAQACEGADVLGERLRQARSKSGAVLPPQEPAELPDRSAPDQGKGSSTSPERFTRNGRPRQGTVAGVPARDCRRPMFLLPRRGRRGGRALLSGGKGRHRPLVEPAHGLRALQSGEVQPVRNLVHPASRSVP